jgi:ATP-dependent RNA helicase RhlE
LKSPETVEVSSKLIEPEKERQPIKFFDEKKQTAGDGAFRKKAKIKR